MCNCLERTKVAQFGLISTIFFGVLNIICIVISGVDYRQTDYLWTSDGEWRHLAPLQVTASVVVFFLLILGMINFSIGIYHKNFQVLYVAFQFLGTILVLSISIFVLVAGAIGINDLRKICSEDYKGMFENFKDLDYLMFQVDKLLCNNINCQCSFTNYSAYEDFFDNEERVKTNSKKNLNNYEIKSKNDDNLFLSIKDCDYKGIPIMTTQGKFNLTQKSKDRISTIKMDKFITFWGRIEKKFKCNGWCKKSYKNEVGEEVLLTKYLFSDINGGVVQNVGCMHRLIDWLPKVVNTFGSVLLIVGVIMIAPLIFGISLLCDLTSDRVHLPEENNSEGSKQEEARALKDKNPSNIEMKDMKEENKNEENKEEKKEEKNKEENKEEKNKEENKEEKKEEEKKEEN